jgi:hypothetical protein
MLNTYRNTYRIWPKSGKGGKSSESQEKVGLDLS